MVRQRFKRDDSSGLFLPKRPLLLPRWLNKHNPGCCGCTGTTCTLFSDNFTRADSSSIGASWTELIGNWEIISNTLRVTSAISPALLLSASAPSQQEYSMTWSYSNAGSGDRFRALFGYVNSSNYYFAELEMTSGTTATIELYQKSGGSDTLLSASSSFTVVSGSGLLNICYNGTMLTASAPGFAASYVSSVITAPAGTELFGLSVINPVTTSDVRFSLVEVKKVEVGCELCRPGNCCSTNEVSPFNICCMFDEFGPPMTMQVDIAGAYDSDGAGTTDCPWCGSDPTMGSWIVTNMSSIVLPCDYLLPASCNLIYDHGMTLGPDGCIAGNELCKVYTQVNFLWIDICATYRIVAIQYTVDPDFGEDCISQPCGGSSTSVWMQWTKDFSWPSGGINAASLGPISLDPDPFYYTGTAAAGTNAMCSYTDAECIVEFLT